MLNKMIQQVIGIGGALSSISLAIERGPPVRNSPTCNYLFLFIDPYLLYFCTIVIYLEVVVAIYLSYCM